MGYSGNEGSKGAEQGLGRKGTEELGTSATQTYKKNLKRSQALMDGAVVVCETLQPVDKCFPK